jgi:hypothetical protein
MASRGANHHALGLASPLTQVSSSTGLAQWQVEHGNGRRLSGKRSGIGMARIAEGREEIIGRLNGLRNQGIQRRLHMMIWHLMDPLL